MPHHAVKVRLVHQTDPQKYFPAVYTLADRGDIEIVGSHRYSVVKEFFRSWLREARPLSTRTRNAASDAWLRAKLTGIRDEAVILGCAPWDHRMLFYGLLARHNRLVYHTSWPNWTGDAGPRRYGPATGLVRRGWLRVLRHPNTSVVAVLPLSASQLAENYGITAHVVPHAVPPEFFEARGRDEESGARPPLRLLHVGELSVKKGVGQLLKLMERDPSTELRLTIVGDGPMRARCERAASADGRIVVLGAIRNRQELARVVAGQDLLLLLSRREGYWQELFGIVIIEAIAAGLGVIASRHLGPESLLGARDLDNLFEEDDLDGVLDLVRRLREDRSFLEAFKAAHTSIADQYRAAAVADSWLGVLDPSRNLARVEASPYSGAAGEHR